MGNKAYDFSSKKKDFLPKNNQIWPENGIFGQFGPGLAGSFGWWLWRAGYISQDTYLLHRLPGTGVHLQSHACDIKTNGRKGDAL